MKDSKINKLTTHPESARVISLYLDEFCDRDLDYINMIAEASRKAKENIDELRAKNTELEVRYIVLSHICGLPIDTPLSSEQLIDRTMLYTLMQKYYDVLKVKMYVELENYKNI